LKFAISLSFARYGTPQHTTERRQYIHWGKELDREAVLIQLKQAQPKTPVPWPVEEMCTAIFRCPITEKNAEK
jgi:hypothetical protein